MDDPGKVVEGLEWTPRPGHLDGGSGPEVFHRSGMYARTTPHAVEVVFVKSNGGTNWTATVRGPGTDWEPRWPGVDEKRVIRGRECRNCGRPFNHHGMNVLPLQEGEAEQIIERKCPL